MKLVAPLVFLVILATQSCATHSQVENFHGVTGIRGEPIEYQTTTSYALHGLFVFPLLGDGGKTSTVESFMEEAGDRGATRARITQTSSFTYWFILPPISFFIHPVVTSVEGDIEGMALSADGDDEDTSDDDA